MKTLTPSKQLGFNYAALDAETRVFVQERAERIHNLARMTAAAVQQIGQYLTEVKERLRHGQFLDWIDREFGWSERSARSFMMVHERFKSANFADLEIDVSALYLIAAPKTPEPVRAQIITRAENGERITFSGTRALVQHFVETGDMPDIQVDLPKMIEAERKRLFPQPAIRKLTRQEQEEAAQYHKRVAENTARNAELMSQVKAIELLANSTVSAKDLGTFINQIDTPDKDWRGKVRQAYDRLAQMVSELKV